MHVKTLSTIVTSPLVLGTGNYGNALTITATGGVDVSTYDAAAMTAPSTLTHARILNAGSLTGGAGKMDTPRLAGGGDGIDFAAPGVIANSGTIRGGVGGTSKGGHAGDGGIGVDLTQGGRISNTGTIAGGAGGSAPDMGRGGDGGAAVDLSGGGVLRNQGFLVGGGGGLSDGTGGAGGAGVMLAAGAAVSNAGTIMGGGGALGGAGVAASGGTLSNAGLIAGGGPYGLGVSFAGAGVLINHGTIQGGAYGGGVAFAAGGTLSNFGTIAASQGSYGSKGYGGYGGLALSLHGGDAVNHGVITGGMGGASFLYTAGAGGYGVSMAGGASLVNDGSIAGGDGGNSFSYYGGYGSTGVALGRGTTLTNHGTITGGQGGGSRLYRAGYGGDAVSVGAHAMLTNTGMILGGGGGTALIHGQGGGGAGVYLDGGTLVAQSGTIGGGTGKTTGDAVEFGPQGGTLQIDPAALFSGAIAGNYAMQDTLVLSGTKAGTLSGLGTRVAGFRHIEAAANSKWTLAGDIGGPGSLQLGAGSSVTLDGAVSIAHVAFGASGSAQLTLDMPAQLGSVFSGFDTGDVIDLQGIAATSLSYANGTLSLLDSAQTVVDTLVFTGHYTQSDFALRADGAGTEVVYAGTTDWFATLVHRV
jgi:hypothetical protein